MTLETKNDFVKNILKKNTSNDSVPVNVFAYFKVFFEQLLEKKLRYLHVMLIAKIFFSWNMSCCLRSLLAALVFQKF